MEAGDKVYAARSKGELVYHGWQNVAGSVARV